jgi:hypothetical protein
VYEVHNPLTGLFLPTPKTKFPATMELMTKCAEQAKDSLTYDPKNSNNKPRAPQLKPELVKFSGLLSDRQAHFGCFASLKVKISAKQSTPHPLYNLLRRCILDKEQIVIEPISIKR